MGNHGACCSADSSVAASKAHESGLLNGQRRRSAAKGKMPARGCQCKGSRACFEEAIALP